MARFDLADAQLERVGEGNLEKLDISLTDVNLDTEKVAEQHDFMAEMRAVVEGAEKRAKEGDAGIELPPIDFGNLDGLSNLQSKTEQLLAEAQLYIKENQHDKALGVLEQLLAEEPHHHEALYLQAYCHAEAGSPSADMRALRCLRPLLDARLDDKLQTRINTLRGRIRDRLIVAVMLETMLLQGIGAGAVAIPKLRELVELDPQSEHFHRLLVGSLMTKGDTGNALAAIKNALAQVPVAKHAAFTPMRKHIERKHLQTLLKPIVTLIKDREFKQARLAMEALDESYQEIPLFCDFQTFVGQLQGGIRSLLRFGNREVLPVPRVDDPEALYFLLTSKEIAEAKRLMTRGSFKAAEDALLPVYPIAHGFPYLRFLLAGCIYRRVGDSLGGRNKPELETVIKELSQACTHAQAATEDPELKVAPSLLHAIESVLDMLRSVRGGGIKKEAKILNAAIKNFADIMESAKGGIESAKQLNKLHGRMKSLKTSLARMEAKIQSDEAQHAFSQLSKAVERNYDQLEEMRWGAKDQEKIGKQVKRFGEMMDALNSGPSISSRSQLERIQKQFEGLLKDARSCKNGLTDSDAQEAADKLIEAIKRVLKQVRGY